jgi:cobalt-zinc-cadmium efflux system membrane fusion protein
MKFYRPADIILFFAIVVLSSCGNTESKTHDDETSAEADSIVTLTRAQAINVGITTGTPEEKQISGTIRVNGVLDVPPQQLVSISAPLGGFLKKTSVLQGSRILKGELIATIENIDFIQLQQDYIEAKSQMELARADYERQQELARENVNSQKTLQQSKSNYTIWMAKYNALREKLQLIKLNPDQAEKGNFQSTINLYSPINGYVTQVNVNIGKFVTPSDVLFRIVDTQHLHAELIVFEKDVLKLKIGQKVRFTLANEAKERTAVVYLIGREISNDRTIQVHCHIDKEDRELLPGMYLSALVEAGSPVVHALPDQAIVDYQGKKYIFVAGESKSQKADSLSNQSYAMIEVETGNSELGYTEIKNSRELPKSGIVVKGAYELLSKMKNKEEEQN